MRVGARNLQRHAAICILILSTMCWIIGPTVAGPITPVVSAAEQRSVKSGAELERSRHWLEAIQHYEESLDSWPTSQKLKYGLRRSKIHFSIERRYADRSFRTSLLKMAPREAMSLFDEVLSKIRNYYVDPVSSTSFVAHGTESLYLALSNPKYIEQNLPGVDRDRVKRFRKVLTDYYWNKPIGDERAARSTVNEIAELAHRHLELAFAAVAMEYVFGGCNALDDYSSFLTPERLGDLNDSIAGEFVGIGIEMKAESGKGMLMVNVLEQSPASESGIRAGDHIVNIDGRDCRSMSTDEAANLLRGPAGSRVRLQIADQLKLVLRSTTLTRRAVQVKSIPIAKLVDKRRGIAYLKMTGFQRTTVSEMDAALRRLEREGMRSLIWDLRGNPGGLLDTAAAVADRFIADGIVVSTRGRTLDQNKKYYAQQLGTRRIPLVLLTDKNSASASEIIAGAIRDHGRGTIIGRHTYGKWSVQSIYRIRNSTGLRLTTAKFYSPRGRNLSKVGVKPDIRVDRPEHSTFYRGPLDSELLDDPDVQKGIEFLIKQAQRQR